MKRIAGLFALLLILTACGLTGGVTEVLPEPTAAVVTVEPTPAPEQPTPEIPVEAITATFTPIPTAPAVTAIPTAEPTARPDCTNDSSFVEDINYPDNTVVEPGETFVKIWAIRNDGTCDWDSAYQFVHIGDSLLGSTGVVPGPFGDAGEVAEIAVSFTAPTEPGTYRSRWQLRSPDGELFGTRPYVQVVVAGGGFDESCIPVVPSVLDTLEEDLGGLLTGTATFESACEFHNWSFPGEAGQQVTISVIPVGSPGVQAGFRLFGDNTTLLADTGLSANPSETLVLPDTTTYVLHVFADGSNVYNIVVEPEGGSAP